MILGGFSLLLFGSVLDITDNFETLNRYVIIGDTAAQAFLEKFVGFLGGFILLAVGLLRWIPSVKKMSNLIEVREQVERALMESEGRFKAVVHHSPTKLHIKDADGRYLLVNREAEKLFGVTDEEARGKTTHEIFGKEQADAFKSHVNHFLSAFRKLNFEPYYKG